jgi:hypothetical protein
MVKLFGVKSCLKFALNSKASRESLQGSKVFATTFSPKTFEVNFVI